MPPVLIYYHLLLLVCALTGSLLVRRNWPRWAKLLVILPWVTQVAEILAWICLVNNVNKQFYHSWYTIWAFLEALTLLYILSRGAILPSVKRLHRLLMMLSPVGLILYFILWPTFAYIGLFYLSLELVAAGAVLIDILVDVSDTPMIKKPVFWLATGMLFFCSLYIVVLSLGRLLSTLPHDKYWPFSCFANTFMYTGFIACFIVLSRRKGREALQE
jgi:hypothetical protein